MEVYLFNPEILEVLTRCGFRYCYSKTVAEDNADGNISIYLTPVCFKPNIRKLPLRYDTYFELAEEPRQMAAGIDEATTVYINLDDTLLKDCYGQENFNHRQ